MSIYNAQLAALIQELQQRHGVADAQFLPQAITTWSIIEDRFAAALGQMGIRLILGRSMNSVRHLYPWLPLAKDAQFSKLFECYAQQDMQTAVAANQALLEAFITLLAALIGASLTTTFLRSAFGDDGAAPISLEN